MRAVDYDATHLVKAVKGLDLNPNAYSYVTIGGQRVRIIGGNKDRAIDWFAEWAAKHVQDLGKHPKAILPVPSSKSTPAKPATFRTAVIAQKIAALCPNTTALPVLRFKAERPNTREEGGSRSPNVLYGEMVLTQQLPDVQVILVDDVMTGGGHFKASAWLVEDQRRKVEQALCCGRSLESQLDDPFTLAPEAIDLARSPFG